MSFDKKELPAPKRVCLRLKESRESKNIPLSEVSRRTRISKKYLEALENCQFSAIPFSAIYQKNFVKCYAEAIGIPADPLLEQFVIEEIPHKTTSPYAATDARKKHLSNLPNVLRSAAIAGVVLILIGYLGFQVKQSIKPPTLTLSSPQNGFIATNQAIFVEGTTEHEAQVSINGQDIRTAGNGTFKEQIYLSPGINTIVVTSRKKHGKSTTETRHVILKEVNAFSVNK